MKKLIEKQFAFIFLIEFGIALLLTLTTKNSEVMKYLFYFSVGILLATCGYKLNLFIEKNNILSHEKICLFSIIEISVYSTLIVLLKNYNEILSIILSIAFYFSLFTIISSYIYIIIKSLDNKDKKHLKYLLYNTLIILITLAITYLKNFKIVDNYLYHEIITLFYMISIVLLVFYISTVALYKAIKTK